MIKLFVEEKSDGTYSFIDMVGRYAAGFGVEGKCSIHLPVVVATAAAAAAVAVGSQEFVCASKGKGKKGTVQPKSTNWLTNLADAGCCIPFMPFPLLAL